MRNCSLPNGGFFLKFSYSKMKDLLIIKGETCDRDCHVYQIFLYW
jgi:hypothetical protein